MRHAQVGARVERKMGEMDLGDFADKAAGSLSGGNQRKLSVAIATISDPPVLFLDGALPYVADVAVPGVSMLDL